MKFASIGFIAALIITCGFILLREGRGQVPKSTLTVMTFNVGTFNSSPPDMVAVEKLLLKSGVPDILLLQEVPGKDKARKLADNLQLEHLVFELYPSGRDGLAVLSKYPLKRVKTFIFDGYAALAAEVAIDNKKILLCSIHLERVKGIRVTETGIDLTIGTALRLLKNELVQETSRSRSVEELLSWVSAQNYEKIIIGGDFNTVPFSTAVRKMNGRFKDTQWPGLNYFAGSYNKLSLPIKPRIDYIFHSPGLKRITASVIKESAGDHYPVRAVFDL